MSGDRRLMLKQRAKRMEETRRRIVEAAFALHTTLGPARTTISAIAERAGVQRLTVYRHFPDEPSLFRACSSYGFQTDPPPDPATWQEIADPEVRLRSALAQQYDYYRRREAIWTRILPDVAVKPAIEDVLEPFFARLAQMPDVLVAGWKVRGRRRTELRAILAVALAFYTWHTLVRQQGVSDDQAIELMVQLVLCAARP